MQACTNPLCRIDTHHHFFPPAYIKALQAWNARTGQNSVVPKDWTPQWALEKMDQSGVATAILSLSTPGVLFGDTVEATRALTRECNEYAARMRQDHKGRFGSFAILPLPDVEGCLAEIAYALDVLGADGFCLTTNVGDRWPGDPAFDAVFAELNRRKTIVFFHPLAPTCCASLMPNVRVGFSELPQDTTRAISSLLYNGTLTRYRDTRYIFSHAGGTMPMIASRMVALTKSIPPHAGEPTPDIEAELARLYYDVAISVGKPTLAALQAFVPVSQILFGTDFPYVSLAHHVEGLRAAGLSDETLKTIECLNAERLMPRLAGVSTAWPKA